MYTTNQLIDYIEDKYSVTTFKEEFTLDLDEENKTYHIACFTSDEEFPDFEDSFHWSKSSFSIKQTDLDMYFEVQELYNIKAKLVQNIFNAGKKDNKKAKEFLQEKYGVNSQTELMSLDNAILEEIPNKLIELLK
jgi:hypothetical protein